MPSPSSTIVFLVGTILAAGSAVPLPRDLPRCSEECPLAGSQKLWYSPEKTYTYQYSSQSKIHMGDMEGGDSQMHWSSLVDLTWLSPCDMAITFREPSFIPPQAHGLKFLTRYPMVVAMIDGRVQHVCTHPEDKPWAINLKRGVASALQNNLPSNSSENSGLSFSEVDIMGTCPTKYEVQNFDQKVVIRKTKNPQQCQEIFSSQRESPMSWIRSPSEMQESLSKCTQEMSEGIYTSITCEDKMVVMPSAESRKYIEAVQRSELKYQSESRDAPKALSAMRISWMRRGLEYEQETNERDPSKVSDLEEAWKQVCENTRHSVGKDTAELIATAISLMRRVPHEAMEQMLRKMKNGEFCGDQQKMENLFLDAVAAVREANTVNLMVREIMNDHSHGVRSFLYTLALHHIHKPSIHAIEAVQPLMEQPHRYPMASLAAASMINKYCKNHHRCQDNTPVYEAVEALSRNCQHHCSSAGSEETCLAALKAQGNLGEMSSEHGRRMADLIGKEGVSDVVQVAAAHSFRNAKCDQMPTGELINTAMNPRKKTEARIASYLAAERCAEPEDWRRMAESLSGEENTQARGFILSHMNNLKRSSAPHRERQRSMLSAITLPRNFESDFRRYSGNMDFSYHPHQHGSGIGMESNVIYAPGSLLPRSVHLNLTGSSGASPHNYGEFGIRTEGFDPRRMIGPEGYFKSSSMEQVLMDLSEHIRHKGINLMQYMQGTHGRIGSINLSDFTNFFTDLFAHHHEKEPRVDLFARFRGQEMGYISLNRKSLEDAGIDRIPGSILDVLLRTANSNIDAARAMQVDREYTHMTQSGLPFKMKKSVTLVAGLGMGQRPDSSESDSSSRWKISPSISGLIQDYYGFDSSMGSCGCQRKTKISSFSGISLKHKGGDKFEYEFDIPEKMELLDISTQTSLTKHTRGHPTTRVSLFERRRPEDQRQHCLQTPEEMGGLKVCYNENILNVLGTFGSGWSTAGKITAEKSDRSMRGWRVRGDVQNNPDVNELSLDMETVGGSTPKNVNCLFTYSKPHHGWHIGFNVLSRGYGGYKIGLGREHSDAESRMEFRVHSSHSQHFSPETEVYEALLSSRYDGQKSEVHARSQTKNTLKPYLDHYFEVQGDVEYNPNSGFPHPRRLHMLNTRTVCGDSRMECSIERTGEHEYTSLFKVGSMSRDSFSLEGKHNLEGSWDEGINTKTTATARIGGQQYKTALYTFNRPEKKGVSMKINRPEDSFKVLECEALFEHSEQTRKARLQLDIPEHMSATKFEGQMQDLGSHRYHIQAALNHGRRDIFHIDGPITANSDREARHFQVDLRVRTMPDNLHNIATLLLWKENKKHLSFNVRDQHEPKFAFEWKKSREAGEETEGSLRLLLPGYVDHNIDVRSSDRKIRMTLNTVFSHGSPSSRRVKASSDVNFEDMKAIAELYWDADRDLNRKASFEATAVTASPHHMTVHGQCAMNGNSYNYRAEMKRSGQDSWLYGKKEINFEVTTPSRRTHHFQTEIDVEQQPQGAKMRADMRYKDPEDRMHQFSEAMEFQRVWRPPSFTGHSETTFTRPGGQQTSFVFDARHQRNSEEREAFVQLRIEDPSMRKPFQTFFNLRHQQGSYKGEWKMEADTPAEVSHYEMRFTPRNRIETLKAGFDMKKINAVLKAASNMGRVRPEMGSAWEDSKYLIHYENPSEASHKILLHSPSRKMEGEFSYSPSEYFLRFNPDKERRNPIYELSFSSQRISDFGEDQVRYKGRFSHPSLERARMLEVFLTHNKEMNHKSGNWSIDIFPRAEDRITGSIETTRPTRDTMRIETILTGRIFRNNPRIIINTAYTSNTKAMDLVYEKSPGARASLSISGKYDHTSGRDAVMNFLVKSEDESVFQISGSSRPMQSSECNGREITAVMHSPRIGRYNILSEVCGTAFVSIASRREGSDKAYTFRGGLQDMRNIELSAWERNEGSQEIRPIAVAQLKLKSPTLLGIEMNYQHEAASNLWKDARERWSTISSSVRSGMEKMRREAINEEIPYSNSDMVNLWRETKEEGMKITHSLPFGSLLPSWETVHGVTKHPFIQSFIDFLARYDQFKRRMNSDMLDLMRNINKKYETLASYVHRGVVNRGRHVMGSLFEIATRMADNWGVRFPEEYEALKKIVERLKEEIDQMQKRGHLNSSAMSDQDVLRIWHQLGLGEGAYQTSQYFSVTMKPNHMKADIPLYQPVSSLSQAGKHMMIRPNLVPESVLNSYEWLILPFVNAWTNSTHSPMNRRGSSLLPPFKKTAMVVDGSEILTFDGAVLRAPPSNCKVLLTSHKTNSVFMETSGDNPVTRIYLESKEGVIVIHQTGEVYFNNKEITEPVFSTGELRILKKENKVSVILPTMTLDFELKSNTISIGTFAFGQVSGLLGTYDGEKANDWNTRQGSRASSLQELVNSWQEDQGCHTPKMEPIDANLISPSKTIQCNVLLGAHTHCSSEVQLDSFMKICHGSRNACHAAKAYQSLCYKMGGRESLPVTC